MRLPGGGTVNEGTDPWTCEDCGEPHKRWMALRDEHREVHWRLPCTATLAEADYDNGEQPDPEKEFRLSEAGHGDWVWIEYGEQPDGAPAWILVEVDQYLRE